MQANCCACHTMASCNVIHLATVDCEQALPQESGITPTQDLLSTDDLAKHSVTSKPCTKYERNKVPEPPNKPSLTCFSTNNPIGICQIISYLA